MDEDQWQCTSCTYMNSSEKYRCEMCNTSKKRERKRKRDIESPATRKAKRPKPFEDEKKPKRTYTRRKQKKKTVKKRRPPTPSPSPEVEDIEEDEEEEEEEKSEEEEQEPEQVEVPPLQPMTQEAPEPKKAETKQRAQMDKVIRKLEADFHNMPLKMINSVVIRDLLKSSEEDCKYFGARLTSRTYIIDSLLQKMITVLTNEPVAKQMKNVGVLHKFIKGLQRLVGTGAEAVFSAIFQEKLGEAAKIDGLPVKTVKRITDLLGTIKNQDYQNPERFQQGLDVPVTDFPGVDWAETVLGPYGEKRVEFEDKFNVRIRLEPGPTGYKGGPLKLLISSLQSWNVDFAKRALQEYMSVPANHKTKQDGTVAKKRWKQVLDKATKAHYYWHMDTNAVRWDAPPEGFQPVGNSPPANIGC